MLANPDKKKLVNLLEELPIDDYLALEDDCKLTSIDLKYAKLDIEQMKRLFKKKNKGFVLRY